MAKTANKTTGATVATMTAEEINAMQATIEAQRRQIAMLEDIKRRYNETETLLNYDYLSEETRDVVEYLTTNYSREELTERTSTEEERNKLEEDLYEELLIDDNVTGNGSGSYWFSTYKSALTVALNIDLFIEACNEVGGVDFKEINPEYIDVTIRCYLLRSCITAAIDDILRADFDF